MDWCSLLSICLPLYADKPKEAAKAPGFVEKLVTQIVRNVEITVKNIHIRYEDAVSIRT